MDKSYELLRNIGALFIALAVVITLCLIVLYDVSNDKPVAIPVELAAPATLIIGFFFGQHATVSGVNGAVQTASKTAAEIHAVEHATDTKPPSQ